MKQYKITIGTDKERKVDSKGRIIEWRVGITPDAVTRLVKLGHTYLIESGAGIAAGYADEVYERAGAEIVQTQEEVYSRADMIYKVKEPQKGEWDFFHEGQIIFTYIHSGNRREMLSSLLKHKVVGIAYEDVRLSDGRLPLLEPMSIIAGHISQQKAYRYLLTDEGNIGIISGNLVGVAPAKVVILGTGFAGEAAIREAHGAGSHVIAFYKENYRKAESIMRNYPGVICLRSSTENICRAIYGAHILNNCMTWPISMRNEILITKEMLSLMDDNGIIIDVSAELQGGIETTRGIHTSHIEPTVQIEGKMHYVVPNIPAIVARAASEALVNVTLPWAEIIASGNFDWRTTSHDSPLYSGLTCAGGEIINSEIKDWYNSI